jgi:uncharacterized repeat protein (TIGR01451 family)
MELNIKRFLFLIITSLLISCSDNEENIDLSQAADLSIEGIANVDNPYVGTNVTFTLTATNKGPLDATAVQVENKIPAGYSIVSFETSAGDYDAETGIWTIGDLNNTDEAKLKLVLAINSAGDYKIQSAISGQQKDVKTSNNNNIVSILPKVVTNETLYLYTISDGPDPKVTITGLSQVWNDLGGDEKFNLTIPGTIQGHPVTEIGTDAFKNQEEIVSVLIPEGVTSIGFWAFRSCGSLETVVLPNTLKTINDNAFYYCKNLKYIAIPNSVVNIGNSVFQDCSNLTEITIPEGVTVLNDALFSNCTNLKSITIPNTVTAVGYRAFYGCTNLMAINFPASLKIIERSVLQGCSSLEEIKIPENVEEIGDYAFSGCKKITNIRIPDKVKKIGAEVFNNCSSLTAFTVDSNPNFSVIDGVLYDKEIKKLRYCPNGKQGAFIFPESVTEIGYAAFLYCKNLTDIKISNGVSAIPTNALRLCSAITVFSVPENVTSIGSNAFDDNDTLTTVIMNSPFPPTANSKLFNNCKSLISIKVPAGSLEAYKTAVNWSLYKDIITEQ